MIWSFELCIENIPIPTEESSRKPLIDSNNVITYQKTWYVEIIISFVIKRALNVKSFLITYLVRRVPFSGLVFNFS